jgi:ABC-2 type transport system permease protein
LREHGVATVAELPLNYKGLVALEGERLTSALFKRYADDAFARQGSQSALVDAFGVISPLIALRRVSMSAAGTDLDSYRAFLEQGEAYRYRLVQRLNGLQAEKLRFASDGKVGVDNRIDRANWQAIAPFVYQPRSDSAMLERAAAGAAILAAWLAGLALLTWRAMRRLGKDAA